MRQIDQRILIDAPREVVWKMLIDPRELRGWHAGYTSVSILTTHETGEGVRRRVGLADTGKDVFEEITEWLEGWGYEYRVIEGGPYRSLTGRFRLQAMPDGTSVQWVISYQPKGLVGVLRDRFGKRRVMTAMMADSLRELRRRVNAMGVKMDDDTRARVGIRGRLDADQRAHYQPRYVSDDEAAEGQPAAGQAAAGAVTPTASPITASVPGAPIPSFVADLTGDEPDYDSKADTQPRKPQELVDAIQAQQAEGVAAVVEPPVSQEDTPPHGMPAAPVLPYSQEAADFAPPPSTLPDMAPGMMPLGVVDDYDEEAAFHQQITPPRGMPVVRPLAERPRTGELVPVEGPETVEPPPANTLPVTAPHIGEPVPPVPLAGAVPPAEINPVRRAADPKRSTDLPPQTPTHDSGEISIWEVFGVQRPSDQDTAALNALIRTAQVRERAGLGVRSVRRVFKRPLRVRTGATSAIGLRLRLALKRARVRLLGRG